MIVAHWFVNSENHVYQMHFSRRQDFAQFICRIEWISVTKDASDSKAEEAQFGWEGVQSKSLWNSLWNTLCENTGTWEVSHFGSTISILWWNVEHKNRLACAQAAHSCRSIRGSMMTTNMSSFELFARIDERSEVSICDDAFAFLFRQAGSKLRYGGYIELAAMTGL
jgi:hypothetical protein